MKSEISPQKLDQVKVVAKRLKDHLPQSKHMERLDIASRLLLGTSSYRDAQKLSEQILVKPKEEGQSFTYGQLWDQKPSFKSGDWYFYPKDNAVVFEGEFSPYPIDIKRLCSSSELLDFILQIQKKKWSKSQIKDTKVSPTYQVDEFISLINELCRYYFNNSIQGVYSPGGKSMEVNWLEAIARKATDNNMEKG